MPNGQTMAGAEGEPILEVWGEPSGFSGRAPNPNDESFLFIFIQKRGQKLRIKMIARPHRGKLRGQLAQPRPAPSFDQWAGASVRPYLDTPLYYKPSMRTSNLIK